MTFKYGLGDEFIKVLQVLHKLGLDTDRQAARRRGGGLAAGRGGGRRCPIPPRSATGCTARRARGRGSRARARTASPAQVYLYHVVDNEWSMREYGSQAVVWQTAINPVVALELLAGGTWSGTGVLGPEAFDAVPFLDLLTAYGSPWGMREGG